VSASVAGLIGTAVGAFRPRAVSGLSQQCMPEGTSADAVWIDEFTLTRPRRAAQRLWRRLAEGALRTTRALATPFV
jgi:hypothetical protein